MQSLSRLYQLLFFSLLTCISLKAQDYRDVVFLKNGSVIKGFYNELYPDDSLRLKTIDGGLFICSMEDVERIAKERNSVYLIDMSDELKHGDEEWRHRGYRGSVEYGNNTNTDNRKLQINSFFTVHGYQFNQYFFAGLGFGLEQISYKDDDITLYLNQYNLPLIADVRFYLLPMSISPVVDLRAGYTVLGFKGSYYNPSIGVDFSVSPRFGLFLLAGYFKQKYDYLGNKGESNNISFRFGFHF